MQTFVRKLLRRLGSVVYGTFFPVPGQNLGAERYLEDLWRDAPARVALVHTLLAVFVFFAPPFIVGKLRTLAGLSTNEHEDFQRHLLHSPFYFIRLAGYAVRGHAMVAALRSPDTRRRVLKRPSHTRVAT